MPAIDYIQQYDSNKAIQFKMVSSTDHIAPVTGAVITLKISKNNAVLSTPAGTVIEVGQGVYSYLPASSDLDTIGGFGVIATATGCDEMISFYNIIGSDGIVDSPELPKANQIDATFGSGTIAFGDRRFLCAGYNVRI